MGAQALSAELADYTTLGYTGSISDKRRQYWLDGLNLTTSTKSNNDLEYAWLGARGFTGSLYDRRKGNAGARPLYVNPLLNGPTYRNAFWAGDPAWSNPGDGQLVTSVRNAGVSGDPTNTGGTDRPTYVLSNTTLNNKPALTFDGGDFLDIAASGFTRGSTWVAALGYLTGSGVQRGITGLGAGAASNCGISTISTNTWVFNAASSINGGAVDNAPHLFVGFMDAASAGTFYIDGVQVATGSIGSGNLARFRIGCTGTTAVPASFWTGGISFVAQYTTNPMTADAGKYARLKQFARNHGITIA
jgi:hypothetical protein